ncbi:uncharacterized protein [Drosophila takahashii]|uniref:uncharacterized protein isoform X2 n=1 Tax=Drosophila takahashii TaxID=29030 RepID=UPI00389963D3
MDIFAEQHINQFQDQDFPNKVQDPFLRFSSEEQKLPFSQLPSEIQDHKISSDIQNVDKFSIEIENQKQEFKDPEELPTEIVGPEKKELSNETQDISASEPLVNPRSRVIPPMPSEDTMRHSIADSLMEILVSDALQARSRILGILQRIDEKRRMST